MKSIFKNFVVIVILLSVVSLSRAQDWPGWRGKNRDGKVENFTAPETWPKQLTKVWEEEVGLGDASVSMVNGKLYLCTKQGADEVGLCIDTVSGKQIWRTVLNPAPEVTGGASSHPGPRSTPTIANGKVYTIGAGGFLNCLDANSGKVIWKNENFKEVPAFFAAMSPLVLDEMCITHLNGHDNGTIVAFNVENGNVLWQIEGEPSTYSSPVLMDVGGSEIIVLQTETDLVGISKDGKLLWRIPTPGESRFYNSTTPIIDGENVIVCGQGIGTKSFKIEKSGEQYSTSLNWHNSEFGGSFNTPVLKNGYLYGNEARLGKLYCLNANNGETAWNDDTTHNRFAATLDLGSSILSLPATGKIIIYEASHEAYKQIAFYTVSDEEVYAHPLVVGNKIYVKDKEMLTCWQVGD